MRGMKQKLLEQKGLAQEGWTVERTGMFRCPHGNLIEDDLRNGHGNCGCSTPMDFI